MSVLIPIDIPVAPDGDTPAYTINTWQLLQDRQYAKAKSHGAQFARKVTIKQFQAKYHIEKCWNKWADIARYLDYLQEDVDAYLAQLQAA